MSLVWRFVVSTLVCAGSIATAAQQADQRQAASVLGPEWKKMARSAGMVFTGTVIALEAQTANDQAVPALQLKFRIDHGIAGVEAGQILTIREWAGAWSMHRPMHVGEHVLLLLYPPSSLGFTSPVSGALGQVALDASGAKVVGVARAQAISVVQLERAIRSARKE